MAKTEPKRGGSSGYTRARGNSGGGADKGGSGGGTTGRGASSGGGAGSVSQTDQARYNAKMNLNYLKSAQTLDHDTRVFDAGSNGKATVSTIQRLNAEGVGYGRPAINSSVRDYGVVVERGGRKTRFQVSRYEADPAGKLRNIVARELKLPNKKEYEELKKKRRAGAF